MGSRCPARSSTTRCSASRKTLVPSAFGSSGLSPNSSVITFPTMSSRLRPALARNASVAATILHDRSTTTYGAGALLNSRLKSVREWSEVLKVIGVLSRCEEQRTQANQYSYDAGSARSVLPALSNIDCWLTGAPAGAMHGETVSQMRLRALEADCRTSA